LRPRGLDKSSPYGTFAEVSILNLSERAMTLLITGGLIVDPAQNLEEPRDLLLELCRAGTARRFKTNCNASGTRILAWL
jgi:hypothetical protein